LKHSNVFYVRETDGSYKPCKNARGVRNELEADFFRHRGFIYEGQTGVYICQEKDLPELLKNGAERTERFAQNIQNAVNHYGLSPRYTQPEVKKDQVFPPDKKRTLARTIGEKGRGWFFKLDTLENGVELYLKESQMKYELYSQMVYTKVDGWMVGLNYMNRKDDIFQTISAPDFDLRKIMLERFEAALAYPERWVDIGIADFFDRRNEADAHNKLIHEARDAEWQLEKENRASEQAAKEQAQRESYQSAIAEAESKLISGNKVQNTEINGQSLILQLFRENSIDVPLRTQGWIKSSLTAVQYRDDRAYYSCCGSKSSVICEYISKLRDAVQEKSIEAMEELFEPDDEEFEI